MIKNLFRAILIITVFLTLLLLNIGNNPQFASRKTPARFTKRNLNNSKRSSTYSSIIDFSDNILWMIEVEIGTPAQKFLLEFDTGSSDIWFPAYNATNSSVDCSIYGCFDASQSSTFTNLSTEYYMQFGTGTVVVTGVYGTDTLSLPGTSLPSITEFQFAVATDVPYETSGLFGIGPSGGESQPLVGSQSNIFELFNSYDNFIHKLKRDGIISNSEFSVYRTSVNETNDNYTKFNQYKNSVFGQAIALFGAVDDSKYQGTLDKFDIVPLPSEESTLAYFPKVISELNIFKKYYLTNNLIDLNGISLNGQSLFSNSTGVPTMIDTGALSAIVPESVLAQIVSISNAKYDNNTELYYTPCDGSQLSDSQLTLEFSGKAYSLPLENILIPSSQYLGQTIIENGQEMCLLPFTGVDDASLDIFYIGTAILRWFYILYDYENFQIGLALADDIAFAPPSPRPSSSRRGCFK